MTLDPAQWIVRVFSRGKATGCDVDHPPPSTAKVKNGCRYASYFPYPPAEARITLCPFTCIICSSFIKIIYFVYLTLVVT
jgi:hypothetical protein